MQMTEQELDALATRAIVIDPLLEVDFDTQRAVEQDPYGSREAIETALFLIRDQTAAITTLRAQLTEARAELVRRVDMHECAMAERDDATLYGAEQKARADRAEFKNAQLTVMVGEDAVDQIEAAVAAQIEEACAVIDAHAEHDQSFCCDGRECGCQGASVHDMMKHFIRQPHDRTALDAAIRAAKVEAWEEAANAYSIPTICTKAEVDKVQSLHEFRAAILALIEREATHD